MSRRTLTLLYAALLCLVAGASIAVRGQASRAESLIPSVENPGAHGVKGLFTYLTESGADARVLNGDFTTVPADVRTVVSLAPTRRLVGEGEWTSLQTWMEKGGTFVYAVPRTERVQFIEKELLLKWLIGAKPSAVTEIDSGLRSVLRGREVDSGGADALPVVPSPLLAGVRSLRVAADDGLETDLGRSAPLVGAKEAAYVLTVPWGKGELVILAGTDLAENRRIGLGDNLQFWMNLARRGPLAFDEFHHREEAAPTRGIAAVAGPAFLQLLAVGVLLGLTRARRFGPARRLMSRRRRSQSEYLDQLSALYAASGVDRALCEELYRSLRRSLFEKLGISATLDDPEVARRLSARTGIPPERYLSLVRDHREALTRDAGPAEFLALSKRFALLEREASC